MKRTTTLLIACLVATSWCAHVRGQPTEPAGETSYEKVERLERQWLEAFNANNFTEAESALKSLAALEARNPNHAYNLACVLAMQNRVEEAGACLLLAVSRGFTNLAHLRSDPNLKNLHGTEVYELLTTEWDRFVAEAAQARIDRLAEEYGPRYTAERDEDLRLAYVSAFDPHVFGEAKTEISRLARWWRDEVLPPRDATDPPRVHPWVIVLLPTRADFVAWARGYAGSLWQQIGGMYSHDQKQLIAQGLGANMRHEFWHVLHWRHMTDLGQSHPTWVMEGLCSLVEDVRERPEGSMEVLPSWRTNSVRNLARAGTLTDWERLFSLKTEDFRGNRKLAYYAQGRAIFMFLHERGKLRDWYAAFIENFDEDPTGLTAMATAFGQPADEVEKAFRAWARDLPRVPEEIRPGMANLPFAVEATSGEGLTIQSITLPASVRRAGLKTRDTLVSIDGHAVRDMYDLVRVMSERKPGQEVEVDYLRRGELATARITLIQAR